MKKVDLTGKKFNKLTVIKQVGKAKNGQSIWQCRCDCGNIKNVSYGNLLTGSVKSCGCITTYQDLLGQRFGRLTVIKKLENQKNRVVWQCQCDCGNIVSVKAQYLQNGDTKSCGCLHDEGNRKTHGLTGTRLHNIWRGIKTRCYSKTNNKYKYYGGHGITVCDEWRNDFMTFYNWSMANGYRDDLTIDRINNNGNYEPSNCRWVDVNIQVNNMSSNRYYDYKGEHLTATQFARKYNINKATFMNRLNTWGDIVKAIETPIRKICKRKT